MIHLPLSRRIWLSFILLILLVGVIIAVIYPLSLQQTLKEDSFELIEQEQLRYILPNNNIQIPKSDISFIERQQAARSVGHLVIVNHQGRLEGDPVPDKVLQKMGQNAYKQQKEIGRYTLEYKGATLYYVVRQIHSTSSKKTSDYLISYMWDTYKNQMVKKLWWRLLWILGVAAILSLFLAAWLARYLKQPLSALGKRFEEISKLNWEQPFIWTSGDEFQQLAGQFEDMRQNLIRYDESQKRFIQQASHELKTPIMVIQSYAQSAKDGLYPQGTLEGTMNVIINETSQMEKRVKKLIYFAKVDSLKDENPERDRIRFAELAVPVSERFAPTHEDIHFVIEGEETIFNVDVEQFESVLENLVENGLRYADTTLLLKAEETEEYIEMIVQNDGEPIPEAQFETLFKPFHKGKKGQFGLGLAIVQSIVERHQGTIKAVNQEKGVAFIIQLPK